MNQIKFLAAFIVCSLLGFTSIAQADSNFKGRSDTTVLVSIKNDATVKIVKEEHPIIIRKGERLTIKFDNPENTPVQVRVHSSLGRLVKQFLEAENEVVLNTSPLLPGVYLVIIKKEQVREIRKVVVTD